MCPLRLPNICCFSILFLNTQTLSISERYDSNAKLLFYVSFSLCYDDTSQKINILFKRKRYIMDDNKMCLEKQPLSQEMLEKMNAYWRAANYLSAGQLYLLDNPLLKEPLTMDQSDMLPPLKSQILK